MVAFAAALPGALLSAHLLARARGSQALARDVADDALPLTMRAALALEVLLLARRRWPAALLLAPYALFAMRALSTRRLTIAPATTAPALRVLSFNMAHWHGQLTPLLELFHTHEADVVAIQELRHDCVAALEETLGERYPYQVLNPIESAYGGQGMLSRYPLHEAEFFILNADAFNHQRAIVDWPHGRFAFYSAHPPSPVWQPTDLRRRRRDLEALLARTSSETLPVIMAGDFNTTEYSRDYALVRQHLHDAYAAAGRGVGATWPDLSPWQLPGLPIFRIDYVFHSQHFAAVEAQVLPSAHSDHRPLLVTLACGSLG